MIASVSRARCARDVVLAGLLMAATPAVAQQPAAATTTAPEIAAVLEPKPLPQVRLPRAKETVLDNGLRVLVIEHYDAIPTFTAQLVLTDAGGLYEPPERRGLAEFTVQTLRSGTADKTAEQVSRELEVMGATLEASAPLDSAFATVTVSGLSTRVDPALALLADIVRHPSFPADELALHASRTLSVIEVQHARPEFVSQEQLLRAIYGEHPAALSAPPADSIRAITRADLQGFHDLHYRPNGAFLVVIGDVTLERMLPALRRSFGDWQRREVELEPVPEVSEPVGRSVALVDRPDSVQTTLQVGALGFTRDDPGYFSLLVMNHIFGNGASSRLYQNLRERHGYTYGAYSGFTGSSIPGVWQITTSVRTDVTGPALQELFAELQRIRREPVSAAELAFARRSLIGKYIFSLERPTTLLDNVVTQTLYGFPDDYWDRYPQQVRAVSAQDVRQVARRLLDGGQVQIAGAGDAEQIRDVLAGYERPADAPLEADGPGRQPEQ